MTTNENTIASDLTSSSYPKFLDIEKNILEFWKENDINNKLQGQNKGEKSYIFLEGPPTANGMPHIGHSLTRVIKDAFLRYKSMKGFDVTPRIGGWDCHGLPVELEVEKSLGINSKEEIEAFGIAKFNKLCQESVFKYIDEWIKMSERIGFVLDMDIAKPSPGGAYVTMTTPYMESVWWSLKTLFDKKMLFKGHKIVPYCPRCGTSLSSHELALGYKDTRDPSIFIKFQLKNSSRKLLVWTTTPWTLISNMLLAVKEDADYAIVNYNNEELIIANSLKKKVLPKGKLVETIKGKDLVGKEYQPLFPYSNSISGRKHFIISAPFVGTDEGSGIVHIAPAFGEDDYNICKDYDVPMFNPVDEKGNFVDEIELFKGQFVKDADKNILSALKERKILLKSDTIVHNYPFCWRCDSPLLYYATESWFIKMSELRKNLVKNNAKIRWQPAHLKEGRFGNFIEEAKDWALSRSRYWGTPLPIWSCVKNHEFAIGSIEELKELVGDEELDPETIDLHKPFIDEMKLKCPECGENTTREPYVIDTWYDSGSAFFAQWHYPFENNDLFDKHFPVDFITEAIDQTRGWFYTLLATSTALFDSPSYLNCLTMGHILAEDGSKMSKSKGNAIAPDDAINLYGADAIRYLLCSSPIWKSTRFGVNLVKESVKSFELLLWNIVSFFRTYTKLDNWKYNTKSIVPVNKRSELDKYVLSALQSTIAKFTESMDNLEIHKATGSVKIFIDDILSNWWIRRSRRRFWDKHDVTHEEAYQTLFEILESVNKLLAPIIPFLTEYFYQEFIRVSRKDSPISIHLCKFPILNSKLVFKKLEESMNIVRGAIQAGRAARAKVNIKNRQPLSQARLIIPNKELNVELENYLDILKEELNVKEIVIVDDAGDLQEYKILPNFTVIGPKFRKKSKKVTKLIEKLNTDKTKSIIKSIEENNSYRIILEEFDLSKEDIRIKITTKEGFEAEEFKNGLLVLNVDLTDEDLQFEGIARDFIRRIQTMRRDQNLPYDDKIILTISTQSSKLKSVLKKFNQLVCNETLSEKIKFLAKSSKNPTSWNFLAFGENIEFKASIKSVSESK
ncbi:MAG: Isoleucine--tRNA ligase [Candidatus Heimdallarchaeota archaeon LC_3]|nr:MAG: Isoleucine--tRNA ligase [Candidatus Heimdallarchaeota archaeon LC_3]